MPHRCLLSFATSSCWMWTRPPTLHDSACLTDILAPQPSQVAGLSIRKWLYLRRTLSLHLSANRLVPFNQCGNTKSHAPAAQFELSRLATEGLSQPWRLRKSRSSLSRAFLAACPASLAQLQFILRSKWAPASTRETVRWQVAASEAKWTLRTVSTGLQIASPPCLTPWVRSWWYPPALGLLAAFKQSRLINDLPS